MNKNDFLLAVHEYLKAFGYRKNKSYWFLSNGELVYCVYVQSSQWDANCWAQTFSNKVACTKAV